MNNNHLVIEKADALFNEGEQIYQQSAFGDYREIFEEAADIYRAASNWEQFIHCKNRIAQWYYRKGNLGKALEMAQENLQWCQKKLKGDTYLKGEAHYLLFMVYFDTAKYSDAKAHVSEALSNYEAVKNYNGMASANMGLGSIHIHSYNYFEGLQYNFKAVKIKKEKIDNPNCCYNYYNIAHAYYLTRQYELAKTYFHHSLSLTKKHYGEDHPLIMSIQNMLGEISWRNKQYDIAHFHLQQAIALQQKKQIQNYNVFSLYLDRGKVYSVEGKWEQAKIYFEEAIKLCTTKQSEFFVYGVVGYQYVEGKKTELGEIYLKKALSIADDLASSKNFNKARIYFNMSLG